MIKHLYTWDKEILLWAFVHTFSKCNHLAVSQLICNLKLGPELFSSFLISCIKENIKTTIESEIIVHSKGGFTFA